MLAIDSFFTSSFFGQLRAIVNMPPSTTNKTGLPSRDQSSKQKDQASQTSESSQPCAQPRTLTRRRRVPRITAPEPGSLYDIMHEHAGTWLYVLPICWVDLHTQLLGIRFEQLPVIDKPVPGMDRGHWLEPSKLGRSLTTELHTLIRNETSPARTFRKGRALKYIMATLFPNTLSRPKTTTELDLYFGQRVFRKAIRIPCLWKTPCDFASSFDSCPTLPNTSFGATPDSSWDSNCEYTPNRPMLAYINMTQLSLIRHTLFRVLPNPRGGENTAVQSLQQLRAKLLTPANIEHDPYIVGVLLSMAQAHFYDEAPGPASQANSKPRISAPKFRDVKVHVISHTEGDESNPFFLIYTATVTATFMRRFLQPHKAPLSKLGVEDDGGLKIKCTRIPMWPLLGLKERIAKALGPDVTGEPEIFDPNHIALWDDLVEPRPQKKHHQPPTPPYCPVPIKLKRRRDSEPEQEQNNREREPLSEVLNSSFSEDDPPASTTSSNSEDRPAHSPDAKRRRTGARTAVNPLEVC